MAGAEYAPGLFEHHAERFANMRPRHLERRRDMILLKDGWDDDNPYHRALREELRRRGIEESVDV